MIEVVKVFVSLFPVLALLGVLIVLDSYKLVGLKAVLAATVAGAVAAGIGLAVNGWLIKLLQTDLLTYSRYVAPITEELLKTVYVIFLFRRNRVGFIVDAAIYGFAVGAGFALVENILYLTHLRDSSVIVWVIRGFGTGAIHASTMALFAVVTQALYSRTNRRGIAAFIPGLILAVIVHSLYNHFILSPGLSTVMILLVLPLLVLVAFERSEQSTREWLGVGFDADQEILRLLNAKEFPKSRIGQYLTSLQTRFPGTVVADMFCLLSLHTELALRAKGMMLLRRTGIKIEPDPEVADKLAEIHYLEKSIGRTGMLALHPFIHTSARDLSQLRNVG